MKKIILPVLTICASVFALTSCRHDPDLTNAPRITYDSLIAPIVAANCAMSGCHVSSSSGGEELFSLEDYDHVMHIVKAGDAHDSKMYESITGAGEQLMPPQPLPSLTSYQIKLVYLWIEEGAPKN